MTKSLRQTKFRNFLRKEHLDDEKLLHRHHLHHRVLPPEEKHYEKQPAAKRLGRQSLSHEMRGLVQQGHKEPGIALDKRRPDLQVGKHLMWLQKSLGQPAVKDISDMCKEVFSRFFWIQ
jgi:hypothetical protein